MTMQADRKVGRIQCATLGILVGLWSLAAPIRASGVSARVSQIDARTTEEDAVATTAGRSGARRQRSPLGQETAAVRTGASTPAQTAPGARGTALDAEPRDDALTAQETLTARDAAAVAALAEESRQLKQDLRQAIDESVSVDDVQSRPWTDAEKLRFVERQKELLPWAPETIDELMEQFPDFYQAAPLKLSINKGLDGLREELLPYLAEEAGAGLHYLSPFMILEPTNAVCFNVEAGLRAMSLLALIDSKSFSGSFGRNGKVEAEVAIDGYFSGELYVSLSDIEHVGCDVLEVLGALLDLLDVGDFGQGQQLALIPALTDLFGGPSTGFHDEEEFVVEDLTVSLDGRVDAVGNQLRVEVDDLQGDLGAFRFDGDGFLHRLTELLHTVLTGACGLLFGTIDLDDCAESAADVLAQLDVIPTIESIAEDAINDALVYSLQFEEDVVIDDSRLSFTVELADIESSKADNEMTGVFDAVIESAGADDSCGNGLSYSKGLYLEDPAPTSSDLDIHVPLSLIAKALYELGRQGELCYSDTVTEPTTGARFSVDIRPEGTLRVADGEQHIETSGPGGFGVVLVEHAGEIRITLPVALDGTAAGLTGEATGVIEVFASLNVRSRNVYLDIVEINVIDVSGTLDMPFGPSIDVSAQVDALANKAANTLERVLPAQPLLPRATALPDGFLLTLSTVRVDSTYITAGVNIGRIVPEQLDPSSPGHAPYPERPGDLDPGILDRLDPVP